jgi:thiosulfate dehydrogenase [quinone] large subunit
MPKFQKISLFLLRVGLGWIYFWAGITKVVNPAWSAGGYLNSAKTFPVLFHWFASPGLLPVTNFVNEWGLTLLGVSLILGVFMEWTAPFGIALMVLYYLPILQFPYPNVNSFIVDEHIIYICGLLVLMAFNAGHFWGLAKRFKR